MLQKPFNVYNSGGRHGIEYGKLSNALYFSSYGDLDYSDYTGEEWQ